MKYFLTLVSLTFAFNCYSETNREILEDIRDELEFMQYERELRNPLSEVERVKQAKFWDLNMSEYLRRDEIGHISCDRYRGTGTNIFSNCYYSKMLNISYTETEMRWNKLMSVCSKIPSGSPKHAQCIKNILVYAS
jgi:hypothetical protein